MTDCTFVNREDALENYLDGLEDDTLYTDLPSTVLRDRYVIHVEDITILTDTVKQVEAVKGVAKVSAAMDVVNGFITVRNVAAGVAVILLGVLLVVSFFIISNAIKMATIHRAEEIGGYQRLCALALCGGGHCAGPGQRCNCRHPSIRNLLSAHQGGERIQLCTVYHPDPLSAAGSSSGNRLSGHWTADRCVGKFDCYSEIPAGITAQ